MKLFDLAGRVAIVTGGNRGIGLAMARGLAQAGASLVIAGRDREKSASAVRELQELGAEAAAVVTDVTVEADCQSLVERSLERFGRLDILINNAGINVRRQPEDYDLAEWHAILDGNLTSAFLCARAAYPAMVRAGGGKIVNVASLAAFLGLPFAAPYAASKGGMVQLTRSLATAWAKDKIQVNAVRPGWIDTELAEQARRDLPGLHERVLARTPAGRWGVPDDLAGIAVFLASSASDFVTGTAISVDGGFGIQA
ncbi:MAG: SDR family NAD(P)-dependent oxidoreductase [Geminicoccaceae bacterium]